MNFKGKMREKSGITLISLVVTIVVLLILAAVSISMLSGENGIIAKAKNAKEKSEISDEKEIVETSAVSASGRDKWGKITEENLANELTKNIGTRDKDYTLIQEGESFIVTYIESNRSYTVDENGNIGEVVKREGLKVGDYINYIPDENTTGYTTDKLTEEITGSNKNTSTITQDQQYAKDGTGMTWQILRIYADGSIDLMGSPTSQTIWLSGANGYNNGVTIINDICEELYSNEKLKAKARNINYEDIIYWLTDMGEEVRDTYLYYTGGPNYGHTQTYTENRSYPNLYAQEIGAKIDSGVDGLLPGIDQETGNDKGLSISQEGKAEGYSKANKTLTVTNTFWKLDLNETNVGKIYSMLCREEEYWIASRYVRCEKEYVFFGIWCVEEEKLNSRSLFYSNSVKNNLDDSVRPIIRLKPDVQIENCIGENTIDNMHKIKY